MSLPAVTRLRAHGAEAVLGLVSALPFADRSFDLVCALDIVEHVDDDMGAMAELVARRGAGRGAAPVGAVASVAVDGVR